MLSLRAHAFIAAGIFAAIIVLALVGDALEAAGMLPDTPAIRLASGLSFLTLCAALMFAAAPIMVKLVLGFHARRDSARYPPVAWLIAHERAIIFAFWALLALGLVIAVPAAIIDGAFD